MSHTSTSRHLYTSHSTQSEHTPITQPTEADHCLCSTQHTTSPPPTHSGCTALWTHPRTLLGDWELEGSVVNHRENCFLHFLAVLHHLLEVRPLEGTTHPVVLLNTTRNVFVDVHNQAAQVACLTQPYTYTKTNVCCYSVSLGMWHNTLGSDNTWMVCYNNALNNIISIDKYNYNYKLPHTSVRMIRNQSNRRFHKMVGLGEVRFANIGCWNIWWRSPWVAKTSDWRGG